MSDHEPGGSPLPPPEPGARQPNIPPPSFDPAAGQGFQPDPDFRAPRTEGVDLGFDPGSAHRPGVSIRPWWGTADVWLGIPVVVVALVVGTILAFVIAAVGGVSFEELGTIDATTAPRELIVVPTIAQQLSMFVWPFIVSRWKGLGPARDWGWAFKPVDLAIGVGVAFIAVFAAGAVQAVLTPVLGVDDEASTTNTAIINDFEGSPWLFGLLFIVVVGAPFSEEIFFRGLIQRSFQKRWGPAAGVIFSVLFFAPIHIADGGPFSMGQVVLWAAIGTLGTILALAALYTNRLAAPIVAHVLVNSFGVAAALGAFDSILPS